LVARNASRVGREGLQVGFGRTRPENALLHAAELYKYLNDKSRDGSAEVAQPRAPVATRPAPLRARHYTLGVRRPPASPCRRRTFPGMAPGRRFEVTAATTVVERSLRLNRSCWTTRAGRRLAGAEPSAGPKCSR
jgi:hypothetical protein